MTDKKVSEDTSQLGTCSVGDFPHIRTGSCPNWKPIAESVAAPQECSYVACDREECGCDCHEAQPQPEPLRTMCAECQLVPAQNDSQFCSEFCGERFKIMEQWDKFIGGVAPQPLSAPQWISVQDRLPEPFIRVLSFRDTPRSLTKIMVNYRTSRNGVEIWSIPFATHWMPLPTAPGVAAEPLSATPEPSNKPIDWSKSMWCATGHHGNCQGSNRLWLECKCECHTPISATSEPSELEKQLQVAHNVLRQFDRLCSITAPYKCPVCLKVEGWMEANMGVERQKMKWEPQSAAELEETKSKFATPLPATQKLQNVLAEEAMEECACGHDRLKHLRNHGGCGAELCSCEQFRHPSATAQPPANYPDREQFLLWKEACDYCRIDGRPIYGQGKWTHVDDDGVCSDCLAGPVFESGRIFGVASPSSEKDTE